MPAKLQEITATFLRERHRFTGSQGDTIIGDALMVAGEGVTSPQNVTVKGVADADGPTTDQTYRFYGFWSAYQNKYSGRKENQFHYQTFVRNAPHSRAGVVGYLEKCPGVGRTTASRIYDKFNSSSIQILREQPDLVADQIPRFTKKKAHEAAAWLADKHKIENLTIELIELLDGRGFRKSTAKAAVERWGNRAGEKIRHNPFCLDGFPGVGFKLCDNLYLELGLPPGALKRQARYLAHHLRKATADGHTWHSADSVYAGLRAALPAIAVDFSRAWRLAQRAGLIVSCYADSDGPSWDASQQWFALTSKAHNEKRVSEYLAAASQEPAFPVDPSTIDGISDHQCAKLVTATSGGAIGILGGSPGTGKTFTAAAYIKAVAAVEGYDNICVAAPTGKAAVRITEAMAANGVALRAKTIHSLLKVEQADDGSGWRFTHGEKNPLPQRLIVVDESSMVDADLMASLLAARGRGSYVLFVGDVNQLSPVGHGAPLRDMIAAGLPYGELTEIHRNDGGIVQACADIRDGKPFDCGGNLIGQTCDNDTPEKQIKQSLAILDQLQAGGVDPIWQCQILVAVNKKSPLSRKEINALLQRHLNSKNEPVADCPFRLNDKVVNLKNRFYPASGTQDGEATTNEAGDVYVANGELGRVVTVEPKYIEVELKAPDRRVRVPRGKPEVVEADDENGEAEANTGCDFDLAYGLTTHRAQGSEWPYVIVLVDEYPGARRICDRAFIYTAISRAKTCCFLVGKLATARNFCRVNKIDARKTFLRELIQHAQQRIRRDMERSGQRNGSGRKNRPNENWCNSQGVETTNSRLPIKEYANTQDQAASAAFLVNG